MITPIITIDAKGNKITAIKVSPHEQSFFDYEKISIIRSRTNDDELTLLYSFIAFKLTAYDKLNQPSWVKAIDDRVWWQLNIKLITEHFVMSERTASRRISKLCDLGLVERKRVDGVWYCSLNQEIYSKIEKEYIDHLTIKKAKSNFGVCPSAKAEPSSLNNTSTGDHIYINNNTTRDGDVNLSNLDEIGVDLNKRQAAYLLAAIKNTLRKVNGNAQQIFGWIKFSILNPCQRQGITKFKHAVNRFIKLLRERRLTMPFGYNKHTEEGRQFWDDVLQREHAEKNRQDEFFFGDCLSVASLAEQSIENCTDEESETWRDLGEISNKDTSGEIMQEGAQERDKRLLNEKAERFAKALAAKSKDELANARILEGLQFELERCVRQGADVDAIHDILANS